MRITLDAREVNVDVGGYADEDDCLCRGCGDEIGPFNHHTVADCLKSLRYQVKLLQEQVKELCPTQYTPQT